MIGHEHPAEVQDTDSTAAPVETGATWRDALLARLHPADHRISDEDIFAILNDAGDGQTAADLCALHDVTVPMYCVWKSKYRQLSLDELRMTRRREQRRRYTVAGLTLLVATLSTGGGVAGLLWAMWSAFPAASAVEPARISVREAPRTIDQPAAKFMTADPKPRSDREPAIVDTGYRIQVSAADTDQQGRALVTKLTSAGYPAYMTSVVVNNKQVFRVRVGPFETLPEAEKTAADLKSAGYAGAWIAR